MFGSLNISITEEKSSPLKYYEAILFQFVNPKAWVICITAVSLFYPEKENLIIGTLFLVIMSTIINLPSISMWAFGGSIIRRYLSNEKLKKIIEWLLAILLFGNSYFNCTVIYLCKWNLFKFSNNIISFNDSWSISYQFIPPYKH